MKSLGLCLVMLSNVALADLDPKFAKLRDGAEALDSLTGFVEHFVGRCEGALAAEDCEKKAELFRRGAVGKKFYMIVTEDSAGVLSMGEATADGVMLNLMPFFTAGDMALTHGAPLRLDAAGNPVMPFIRMEGQIPDGWTIPLMTRQVQARALRLQIVFTPQAVWSLPKKGGQPIKGVKAKIEGVEVQVGRTGDHVALWLASAK